MGVPMQRPVALGERTTLTDEEFAKKQEQAKKQAQADSESTAASDPRSESVRLLTGPNAESRPVKRRLIIDPRMAGFRR